MTEKAVAKPKKNKYRDDKGVRIQKYRRFKPGRDYEEVEPDEMVTITNNIIENLRAVRKAALIGRPPKYENLEDFLDVVEGYMKYVQDANLDGMKLIPDIEGLCAYMNISRETLNTWERTRSARYSDAIKMVKNQIAYAKKQLALKGKIPPIVFATDFNNNHGYTQKQEVVLAPKNPLGDEASPDEIRKRLASGDVETIDV